MPDYYYNRLREQYYDSKGAPVKDPTQSGPCRQPLVAGMVLSVFGGVVAGIGMGSGVAALGGVIGIVGLITLLVGVYRAGSALDYLHRRERLRSFGRDAPLTIAPSSERPKTEPSP